MAEEIEVLESELQLRGRLMVDRDPSERRMDTLARLISGKSICVAVALINGKLYISATLHKNLLDKRQVESPQLQVATFLNQTEAKSPDSKKIKNNDN